MSPWLYGLLYLGAATPPPEHELNEDHLETARRAVAKSYRDDGCGPLARIVESGFGDSSQRMRGAIAAATALLVPADAPPQDAARMPVGLALVIVALAAVAGTALAMGAAS